MFRVSHTSHVGTKLAERDTAFNVEVYASTVEMPSLGIRAHPWVPAGDPQYTGAHHGGVAVGGPTAAARARLDKNTKWYESQHCSNPLPSKPLPTLGKKMWQRDVSDVLLLHSGLDVRQPRESMRRLPSLTTQSVSSVAQRRNARGIGVDHWTALTLCLLSSFVLIASLCSFSLGVFTQAAERATARDADKTACAS